MSAPIILSMIVIHVRYAGSLKVNDAERETGKPSSNYVSSLCFHFHTNTLEVEMHPSLLHAHFELITSLTVLASLLGGNQSQKGKDSNSTRGGMDFDRLTCHRHTTAGMAYNSDCL